MVLGGSGEGLLGMQCACQCAIWNQYLSDSIEPLVYCKKRVGFLMILNYIAKAFMQCLTIGRLYEAWCFALPNLSCPRLRGTERSNALELSAN